MKMFSFHGLEFKRNTFGVFALAPNISFEISSFKKKESQSVEQSPWRVVSPNAYSLYRGYMMLHAVAGGIKIGSLGF